jgi:hypothetical protein
MCAILGYVWDCLGRINKYLSQIIIRTSFIIKNPKDKNDP